MWHKSKKHIVILTVLSLCLLFLTAASISAVVNTVFYKSLWTLSEINRGLRIPVPDAASNVMIEGHPNRGGFLRLTFDAPADEAEIFAEQFCEGTLHPGYDPFSAIDIAEPFTYAVPIEIDKYKYFSYSDNVDESIRGNRCLHSLSYGQLQIRLDAGQAHTSRIMLDRRFSCEDACHFIPLNIIRPIPNTPIEVLGITEEAGVYRLINREICIGLALRTPSERGRWQAIVGGDIEVAVDSQRVFATHISPTGTIVDRLHSGNEAVKEETLEDYFYCFPANNRIGIRQLLIIISTPDGYQNTYKFSFQV